MIIVSKAPKGGDARYALRELTLKAEDESEQKDLLLVQGWLQGRVKPIDTILTRAVALADAYNLSIVLACSDKTREWFEDLCEACRDAEFAGWDNYKRRPPAVSLEEYNRTHRRTRAMRLDKP